MGDKCFTSKLNKTTNFCVGPSSRCCCPAHQLFAWTASECVTVCCRLPLIQVLTPTIKQNTYLTSKLEDGEPCLLNIPCILIFCIWYLQTYSPCSLWSCRIFGTHLLSFLCSTWHLVIVCWQTSPLLSYTLQHSTNGTVKTYSTAQIQGQNFEKRCIFLGSGPYCVGKSLFFTDITNHLSFHNTSKY